MNDWYIQYGEYALVCGVALIFLGLMAFGWWAFWATYGKRHDEALKEHRSYFDAVMDELDEEFENGKRSDSFRSRNRDPQ